MAWRIHESVVRGEIDNRVKDQVTGKIWLHGEVEPLVLQLAGNACPDLAGCRLHFQNLEETFPMPSEHALHREQKGNCGDLTASRKVRKPLVPIEEFLRLQKAGLPAPETLANCLYLEWYSEANGRVVIESTDYRLEISAPSWRLTPDDESQRREDAAEGFNRFLKKLNDAVEQARHEPPPDKEWDEFDYEKFMRESDARTDKLMELYEKFEGDPHLDQIIAREMGWEESEGEEESEEGDSDGDEDSMSEDLASDSTEPVPDPATEGIDWVRDEHGELSHPLALRAYQSAIALRHRSEGLASKQPRHPDLVQLLTEYQVTAAKLAGALNGLVYGRDRHEAPLVVASLKRALGHLHKTQQALAAATQQQLLPEDLSATTRRELFDVREEILRLMQEFRQQSRQD